MGQEHHEYRPDDPEAAHKFDEEKLNKGHLRKLTALRKSLGQEIADKAFAAWLERQSTETTKPEGKNAKLMVEVLEPLVLGNKLKIPRGGYLVKRGRGRIVVSRPKPK